MRHDVHRSGSYRPPRANQAFRDCHETLRLYVTGERGHVERSQRLIGWDES